MRRDQCDPQTPRDQHHHGVHASGQLGEPLGVSRVFVAGRMQRPLLRRPGDDGIDAAGERQLHGLENGIGGEASGIGNR